MYRSENPEEDFRNVLEKRLSVDNLVYHGSLVAFHKNQLDHRAEDMPLNDVALYHLLNVRARDMDAIDKPWDANLTTLDSVLRPKDSSEVPGFRLERVLS